MINVFLDCLIYNFTPYKSFFFLSNINNKSIIYNIATGLFIDIFIIHIYFLNTIFIILLYILHKVIKINYYNIINYYLFNITTIFIYYIIFSYLYNFKNIFFNMFIINSIFILLCYMKDTKSIKLYRWDNGRIYKWC